MPEKRLQRDIKEQTERITLAHGSGGRLARELVNELVLPAFDNPILARMDDSALLPGADVDLAMTTDSFVVKPLVFPGGDIGKLAVCGTINDLAVQMAIPRYITVGLIIEEGFSRPALERIIGSMASAARAAGVLVVAGDTKVVEAGAAQGLYVNTTGVGERLVGETEPIEPGDRIIVSGTIGEHGLAIMAHRYVRDVVNIVHILDEDPTNRSSDENLNNVDGRDVVNIVHILDEDPTNRSSDENLNNLNNVPIGSDCAALHPLIADLCLAVPGIKWMRDPTRGGMAAVLNELAEAEDMVLRIDEIEIPVGRAALALSELLGTDPLYSASEGRFIAVAEPAVAAKAVEWLRQHPLGCRAAVIGAVESVGDSAAGSRRLGSRVVVATPFGSRRLLHWPTGEQQPRIC